MTILNHISTTVKAVALAGTFSLIGFSTTQAAFVALPLPVIPETPGVALGGLTTIGVGKVVDFKTVAFVDNALPTPFASGILNSFVVDRGGGLLDFYYQVVNTSPGPDPLCDADFYRFKTTGGFNNALNPVDPVFAAQLHGRDPREDTAEVSPAHEAPQDAQHQVEAGQRADPRRDDLRHRQEQLHERFDENRHLSF